MDNRISQVPVDLSSMSSVRSAAREINRAGGHIDALLHVAAVFAKRYHKTSDGFELMLATNYFGPFLLTNLLRDRMLGGGRVVTVTAPSTTHVDMERLFSKEHFDALHSFGATRALDLMFTFELARRAKRWEVRANAFHPGLVRSQLMREAARPMRAVARLVSGSAERAAQDLVELSISRARLAGFSRARDGLTRPGRPPTKRSSPPCGAGPRSSSRWRSAASDPLEAHDLFTPCSQVLGRMRAAAVNLNHREWFS